jgi:hypothetical protein
MDIRTASDVQLLVEDMGWKLLDINEIVNNLEELNARELKAARILVNKRVWDETFDDEMAVKARWEYMRRTSTFADAIYEWQKSVTK